MKVQLVLVHNQGMYLFKEEGATKFHPLEGEAGLITNILFRAIGLSLWSYEEMSTRIQDSPYLVAMEKEVCLLDTQTPHLKRHLNQSDCSCLKCRVKRVNSGVAVHWVGLSNLAKLTKQGLINSVEIPFYTTLLQEIGEIHAANRASAVLQTVFSMMEE